MITRFLVIMVCGEVILTITFRLISYLLKNKPNPFSVETFITFQLPDNSEIELNFLDATGKLLFSKNGFFEKGMQEIKIRKEELMTKGLVFYELKTEQDSKVGKMIVH